ncbi:YdcF family protein [Micromonospora sp. NPDC023644]|uniref:YdcF family protein n=1 Tax=Micromonospora sp. NPDC023644 TaxID=3154321 RepID=UPI0033CD29CF
MSATHRQWRRAAPSAHRPTAPVLLVFGCGVHRVDGRWTLTPASAARVDAAVAHVATYRSGAARLPRPRVVFSGGWPGRHRCEDMPPPGCREGDLMLSRARAAGLGRYADLMAETRSTSTLENVLYAVEDGLLADVPFGPGQPLGLVSHPWHLPRVRFLAGRLLRLPTGAMLDIPVPDAGTVGSSWSPRALHAAAWLGLLGARSPAALLRRERRLVALVATLTRRRRRPPAPPRRPETARGRTE